MKLINKLIFSTSLLLGIASCASSHRERAIENESAEASIMSGELEAQFTTDYLSSDLLDALEVRAQQKLLDFADYVVLISNPTIDSAFRTQAKEQALELFIQPEIPIIFEGESTKLEDFFSAIHQKKGLTNYTVRNIEIAQPLQQESDQQYTGSLSFSQSMIVDSQETVHQREVKVWVKKTDKQFGNKQKEVWEVFLGAVE